MISVNYIQNDNILLKMEEMYQESEDFFQDHMSELDYLSEKVSTATMFSESVDVYEESVKDAITSIGKKIIEIVDTYHFVPNNNAKHLKQTVSKSILVLVRGTSNMLFANVIEALQATLEHSDYSLRVHYLDEEANEVAEAVRLCREHKPRGVFFLGSKFLFDKFAVFMKNTAHVIKINGQLHIYKVF